MSWNNAPVLQKLTASQLGGNHGAQIWGVDVKGQLYTTYQNTPGGEWTRWMKASEWLPGINHPKYVYELAAGQLSDGRCRLFVLDHKREIWGIPQDEAGNFTHWWHPSRGYWNNAPAAFKKMAVTHGSKPAGSLSNIDGGAMFIGLKEDGRFAVCFNTGDSWSRFRNDWHGVGPAIIEVTACQQGDGRIAIWALDEARQLWGTSENTAGTYDFGPWAGPNWLSAPKLRNIAAVQSTHGAVIVGIDDKYALRTNFQTSPGSNNWSGWSPQHWAQAPECYEITASGLNHNGLAQIWAVTLRQNLTSIVQRDANTWPTRWTDYDPA